MNVRVTWDDACGCEVELTQAIRVLQSVTRHVKYSVVVAVLVFQVDGTVS